MKTFHHKNFFKHTFCEFQQVKNFEFPEETIYKSKSESIYFYTEEGIYRKSTNWGRVENCRWKLLPSKNYKNQQLVVGFAKWSNLFPLNETERLFYFTVNWKERTVDFHYKKEENLKQLFTLSEAIKRKKIIQKILNEKKWAAYFLLEIEELRTKIITELIHSTKSLIAIKSAIE